MAGDGISDLSKRGVPWGDGSMGGYGPKRQRELTESERDEIARIVEMVAKDGLPGPRDLDVALDAIEAALES